MSNDHPPIDPEEVRKLEAAARDLGEVLSRACNDFGGPHRWGFALVLFRFDGGELSYVSNADRADMLRMFQEFITRVSKGDPGTQAERN